MLRKALLGGAFVALVLGTATALAGSGVGGVFNLGQTNSVNQQSTLTGTSSGSQLRVQNGSGAPALSAVVTAGKPPLAVNSSGKVANLNSDLLDGFDSTVFSRRPVPSAAQATKIDTGNVGKYTSITIGSDGLGLISYWDVANGWLKVAHCSNLACTSVTKTAIDKNGDVGGYTSITIGKDGLGLISYYDFAKQDLKVAHCSNILCTSATITTLDSTGDVGQWTSITISGNGLGIISYEDATAQTLKVALCANVACTSRTLSVLDNTASVGPYTSITMDGQNDPVISYFDQTNGHLKTTTCLTPTCSAISRQTIDNTAADVGRWTSIVTAPDGRPLISYYDTTNQAIKLAHCYDSCAGGTTYGVTGAVADETSVTIGADGLPIIAWHNTSADDIEILHCENLDCTDFTAYETKFGKAPGNAFPAMTIGADGLPLLVAYDTSGMGLWAYHCTSPFCTPYFRRR